MTNSNGMNPKSKINFADFQKVEITVGKILSAEKVPETDKLLKLMVDFGLSPLIRGAEEREEIPPPIRIGVLPLEKGELEKKQWRDIRQIISGIAGYFPEPSILVGKKCMFVTNLEPRVIKGLESNGMLFAVSTEDGKFSLLEPSSEIQEGTRAR